MILNKATFHLLTEGDRLRYLNAPSSPQFWCSVRVISIVHREGRRHSFNFIDENLSGTLAGHTTRCWIPSVVPLDAWEWLAHESLYTKWFDTWLPLIQGDE